LPRHTEQSGREFASADPTKGAQDATLQEPRFSAEISFHSRGCLQHIQRPTPPHLRPCPPGLSSHGDERLACGRCGLKLRQTEAFRALGSTT
jgi:hypothetical protein